MWATLAGSFGFPRTGWGARNGESVSTSSNSEGSSLAAACSSDALGYVTLPANEHVYPCSAHSSTRPGAEKQVYQRIELLPAYGSRTLIALETPAKLGNALMHTPTGDRRIQLQELGGDELRFVEDGLGYS